MGLKDKKVHARSNYKSEANPEDELTVNMPRLNPNSVIYPGSFKITYNYKLNAGKDETDIPDHLSSAIIERYQMHIGGKTVFDINNYGHLAVYRELWHSKHRYETELTERGIQTDATKKKRHEIAGAADDVLGSTHGERYTFPLGDFLTESPFCPQAIHDDIVFKLKLAAGEYTLKNIQLEYDYIDNATLATAIKAKYANHRHMVDEYVNRTTVTVPTAESEFEIDLACKMESLREIVMLPKADNTVSTIYPNMNPKWMKVDIDNIANQLYSCDYIRQNSYRDAKDIFQITAGESNMNQTKFYTDKYSQCLDFRTIRDDQSSGVGRKIEHHVKVRISKEATSARTGFVYTVNDMVVSFLNNQITDIQR